MTGVADVTPGGWVSGAGHVVLVVWLISGLGLNNEPLPLDVTPISVVSGEEYEALMAARTPDPATELGQEPAAPEQPAADDYPPVVVPTVPVPASSGPPVALIAGILGVVALVVVIALIAVLAGR